MSLSLSSQTFSIPPNKNQRPKNISKPKFSGRQEDTLFKSYAKFNPYMDKVKEIENSPKYQDIVKTWNAKADDNLAKDALMLGTRVGTIAGGIYVKAHGVPTEPVDEYVDAIAVGVAGYAAEKSIKPIYKLLTKPELEQTKEALKERSDNLHYDSGDVGLACKEIRKRVIGSHPLFCWPYRETRVANFLSGFISDYGADQYWVKKLLPEIKGHPDTKKYITSLIKRDYEKCKDADYSDMYHACSNNLPENHPANKAFYCPDENNVFERALDHYICSVGKDIHFLDPKISEPKKFEEAAKFLQNKTPEIIKYLDGN